MRRSALRRTLSWTAEMGALRAERRAASPLPVSLIASDGSFDRRAIMQAATRLARASYRSRVGSPAPWQAHMRLALARTWAQAKAERATRLLVRIAA